MIHIRREEIETSPGFEDYLKFAAKKRVELFEQSKRGEKVKPLKYVWTYFKKEVLRSLTRGRCMYCEWPVEGGGDLHVEHYRPKGAVTESDPKNLSKRREVLDGHDGYWWLAYEWQNLTLSCAWCNTAHSDVTPTSVVTTSDGRHAKEIWESHPGKANEFPIGGERVFKPCEEPVDPRTLPDSENTCQAPGSWWTDLEREKPLLLHPYWDNPFEHFELDEKQDGVLRGKTARGQRTIDVCDLNRPALVEARAKSAKATARNFRAFRDSSEALQEGLDKDHEFSQFVRKLDPRNLAPKRGKGFSFYVALYIERSSLNEKIT